MKGVDEAIQQAIKDTLFYLGFAPYNLKGYNDHLPVQPSGHYRLTGNGHEDEQIVTLVSLRSPHSSKCEISMKCWSIKHVEECLSSSASFIVNGLAVPFMEREANQKQHEEPAAG